MDADVPAPALPGGCQCGAVRYRLHPPPNGASICHCRMCQKAGGAPFMAFTGVAAEDFVFTRGALANFAQLGNRRARLLLRACGTPLTYQMKARDRISVTLGSLDDPAAVAPDDPAWRRSAGAVVCRPAHAARSRAPSDWLAQRRSPTSATINIPITTPELTRPPAAEETAS